MPRIIYKATRKEFCSQNIIAFLFRLEREQLVLAPLKRYELICKFSKKISFPPWVQSSYFIMIPSSVEKHSIKRN